MEDGVIKNKVSFQFDGENDQQVEVLVSHGSGLGFLYDVSMKMAQYCIEEMKKAQPKEEKCQEKEKSSEPAA